MNIATPKGSRQETAGAPPHCAYLGRTAKIIGNLRLQSGALIDGKVKGNIEGIGHLIIGKRAEIVGKIQAASVVVLGRMKGNIKATERIEIRAPARIFGKLSAPILLIEPGAVLNPAALPGKSAGAIRRRRRSRPRSKGGPDYLSGRVFSATGRGIRYPGGRRV